MAVTEDVPGFWVLLDMTTSEAHSMLSGQGQ